MLRWQSRKRSPYGPGVTTACRDARCLTKKIGVGLLLWWAAFVSPLTLQEQEISPKNTSPTEDACPTDLLSICGQKGWTLGLVKEKRCHFSSLDGVTLVYLKPGPLKVQEVSQDHLKYKKFTLHETLHVTLLHYREDMTHSVQAAAEHRALCFFLLCNFKCLKWMYWFSESCFVNIIFSSHYLNILSCFVRRSALHLFPVS